MQRRQDEGKRLFTGRQLTVTPTAMPRGLKLRGEIDSSNVIEFVHSLAAFQGTGGHGVHLDLSDLLFCDVSGIRAMVSYAQGLDAEEKLLLHGMPEQIEKVINVLGWAELPGLEFCKCELGE